MPRVNFTGRKRIPRRLINCVVHTQHDDSLPQLLVNCSVDLSELEFPPGANVVLEAYLRARVQRVPLNFDGKSAYISNHLLHLFHPSDPILFRLKVASPEARNTGMLLGTADRVRPEQRNETGETRRTSLLSVRAAQLGERIWRLAFDDSSGPVLEINNELSAMSISRDAIFSSIAFPEILHEILVRILVVDKLTDPSEAEDWQYNWLLFCGNLPGTRALERDADTEDKLKWIDEIVHTFSRQFHSLSKYITAADPDC